MYVSHHHHLRNVYQFVLVFPPVNLISHHLCHVRNLSLCICVASCRPLCHSKATMNVVLDIYIKKVMCMILSPFSQGRHHKIKEKYVIGLDKNVRKVHFMISPSVVPRKPLLMIKKYGNKNSINFK